MIAILFGSTTSMWNFILQLLFVVMSRPLMNLFWKESFSPFCGYRKEGGC